MNVFVGNETFEEEEKVEFATYYRRKNKNEPCLLRSSSTGVMERSGDQRDGAEREVRVERAESTGKGGHENATNIFPGWFFSCSLLPPSYSLAISSVQHEPRSERVGLRKDESVGG